jgi:pilus assembly protein TadC
VDVQTMYQAAALSACGAGFVGLVLGLPWFVWVVLGIAGFVAGPRLMARQAQRRRRREIVAELPDALGPILEGLRLAENPIEVLRQATVFLDEGTPIREEFEEIISDIVATRDFERALQRFARRVQDPIAYDLARVLAIGFERRADQQALTNVRQRLVGVRTLLIEKAIGNVPNVMVAPVLLVFLSFCALGSVMLYSMLLQHASLLP